MHDKQQKETHTTAVMVNTQCQNINSVNSYCRRFGHIKWVCTKKKRNRNKNCNNFLFPNVEKFYFEEKHYKVIRWQPVHITSTFHVKSTHEPPTTVNLNIIRVKSLRWKLIPEQLCQWSQKVTTVQLKTC